MPESLPTAATAVLSPPAVAGGFTYHRPGTAAKVDDLLAAPGGTTRLLAGGTDLLVGLRSGAITAEHVVDLVDVAEVRGVHRDGERLHIGAGASLWTLAEHPVVRTRFAALAEAVRCVGSLQIQARATLAGNVCNASPAADTSPALLLYDAEVGVRSARGQRSVPLADLWTGPRRTVLEADEWVDRLTLTDPGRHGSAYVKLGRTRGVDLALVGVAVLVTDDATRVAACSVAPTVGRLPDVERALDAGGDVERAVAASISPISDIRAGADYRRAMTAVCSRRAHAQAVRRRDRPEEA
jgi:CO/xanthine dehydrogenase FAD-binding subunit